MTGNLWCGSQTPSFGKNQVIWPISQLETMWFCLNHRNYRNSDRCYDVLSYETVRFRKSYGVHKLYLIMYENAGKIHRIGNAITPKSFETFYLNFETSNLKPVFTSCEKCKLVSFENYINFFIHLSVYKIFVLIISNIWAQ